MAALESQLIITADDRTAAAFASVQSKLMQLQSTIAAVDKASMPAAAATGAFAKPGAALASMPAVATAAGALAKPGAALAKHADAIAAQTAATDKATVALEKNAAAAGSAAAEALSLGASAMIMGTGVTAAAVATAKAIGAGADYQTELVKLRNAGITGEQLQAADQEALALSARYPNVGRVEAMEEYRALRSVASKPEEVPGLMPTVVAALSAMKGLGMHTEAMPNLYKAAETLGQTRDPAKFERFIDSFVKMEQYAGHTITPETVQKFAQQMKLSGATVSDQFIEHMMFLLAQETGTRGGAGLAGLLKEFSGHIGGKEAAEWERLGFLGNQDLLYGKNGAVTGIKPGRNIANWEQALADPDLFVWTKLVPAMEKSGITSPLDQIKEVQALFGNERAAAVIGKLIQQEAQFKTHLANLQGVSGTAGADAMLQTASGGVKSLATQALNLAGIVTQPLMTVAGESAASAARDLGLINQFIAWASRTEAPHFARSPQDDLKEAKDLFNSIHVGRPTWESSADWHADMRATRALWDAGYRSDDLTQEVAREHARAVAASPLAFRGASDWESRAGSLTIPVAVPQQPPAPAEVNVQGQAQVEHEITVRIEPSPLLTAIVDQARQQSLTTVPLIGGGTGVMDSDAAPHRVGGIGHF